MKWLTALKHYKRLSPEHRETLQSKSLCGKKSLRVWIKSLRNLGEFDTLRDEAMSPLGWSIAFLFLLQAGLLFVLYSLDRHSSLFVPVYVTLGVGTICLLWFLTILFRLKTLDAPNSIRDFLYPFLRILAAETSFANKAHLELSFRNRQDSACLIRGPEPMVKNTRPHWMSPKETLFESPWLRLSTVLADGTKFQLSVVDTFHLIEYSKRGSSGKIRHRRKYKLRVRIQSSFCPPDGSEWLEVCRDLRSDNPHFVPTLRPLLDMIANYYEKHPPKISGGQL